ncbi:MAG: IS110 family transposase [Bacteroidetes bacterium]|nr:MAG: IS110 family transposase [Bacteroidota bacterium]
MVTHTLHPIIVGFDVHKDTIMACTFDRSSGEVGTARQFNNIPDRIARFVRTLRASGYEPEICYEASSCGYVIYRQLRALGVECAVIAPTSIPRRAGERIKTDRRDAEKLATMYAGSLLETVQVPDLELEQVRALVRCRLTLSEDLTRSKHRTTRLLESRGHVYREGQNWTQKFWAWLNRITLEGADETVLRVWVEEIHYLEGQIIAVDTDLAHEAEGERFRETVKLLGAFRGVALLTALTLATELGDIRRFSSPRQLMAYLGMVPSEHSSGARTHRGSITKTGNTRARKALVSAAWKYAAKPARSRALKKRQEGVDAHVIATAWKAQQRLYKRFHALAFRKPRSVANVAVARELAGFLWAALQPKHTHT